MKALILNSGIGKRMGSLGQDMPKSLLQIEGEETILSRQLRILMKNGVNDFLITTGHFEDKLKDYLNNNFKGLNIRYVYNPRYKSTNSIYSFYLAKYAGNEDIIFLHGDIVADERLFKKLLKSDQKNAVLVRKIREFSEKDFKARIKQGRVAEISTKIFEADCYPLFPAFKLSNEFYKIWLAEVEKEVSKSGVNLYAEDVLNRILPRLRLEPVYFSNGLCMEIDDCTDLEAVKRLLKNKVNNI